MEEVHEDIHPRENNWEARGGETGLVQTKALAREMKKHRTRP